ncbi:MAG: heme-binding protein [Bacteroidetes bacterium]|nr:heme-binding protein [Bacteroidota bacterium]
MRHSLLIALLSLIFQLSFAQLSNKPVLTLDIVKHVAAAAENEARANNLSMAIAILDDGGHLLYFSRMDNVQLGSIDVALEKARTALYFKRPTKSYQDRVANGELFLLKVPNIIPVEGGLPLIYNNQVLGSIGISGGTPQQDGLVAQAAVKAFHALCGQQ